MRWCVDPVPGSGPDCTCCCNDVLVHGTSTQVVDALAADTNEQ
jgi:hypothetical protein